MSKGDQLVVLVTRVEPLRGFNEVTVEHRRAGAHANKPRSSAPLLGSEAIETLSRRGEYELYKQALAKARAQLRQALLKQGFLELETLETDQNAIQLRSLPLQIQVTGQGRAPRVLALAHPSNEKRLVVHRARPQAIELSHERQVTLAARRMSGAWLSADLKWLVFAVDSTVPLHTEVTPQRTIHAVPLQRVLRRLGILPAALLPPPAG